MASQTSLGLAQHHLVGVDELKRRWGWFVGVGILLVVLGLIAIAGSAWATFVTMIFLGWLMVAGGILQIAHAFAIRAWGGFFVDVLVGVLYVVAGGMILTNPAATAAMLTLIIAMLLICGGVFRIVVAAMMRFQHTLWLLLHGVINLLLGIAILKQWPLTGLYVIGLFVGIDMLFNGWTLIMLGLVAKRLGRHLRGS